MSQFAIKLMKKLICLFVFICCSQFLHAQNWHVVQQNDTNYYCATNQEYLLNNFSGSLFYINVEQRNIEGIDSAYAYYSSIKISSTPYYVDSSNNSNLNKYCVDTLGASWLGRKSYRKNNGDEYFITDLNDTVFIQTQAQANTTWLLLRNHIDSIEVYATVGVLYTQQIDFETDSFKKITLHTFKNGIPFAHILNNKEIILSKNNGIFKFFNTEELATPYVTSINYMQRIDRTKYINTKAQVVTFYDELYHVGNAWSYNNDINYMFGNIVGFSGYQYDSVIAVEVLNSDEKRITLKRFEKILNTDMGLNILYKDTILQFIYNRSTVQGGYNLFQGFYPNKTNIINLTPLYISNANSASYTINDNNGESELLISNLEIPNKKNNVFKLDSCVTSTFDPYLAFDQSNSYTIYNLKWGKIYDYYDLWQVGLADYYDKYSKYLSYYRINDSVFGNFPLPVSHLTMQAVNLNDNENVITWQTLSEENVNRFEIEQSIDNINFINVGHIKALGSTNNKQQYSFSDNISQYQKIQTFYYRIKSVDMDGKIQYSTTTIARKKNNEKLQLFPNPVSNLLHIQWNTKTEFPFTIICKDIAGKILFQHQENALVGNNHFIINEVENLSKGLFFIEIEKENSINDVYKFLKQ